MNGQGEALQVINDIIVNADFSKKMSTNRNIATDVDVEQEEPLDHFPKEVDQDCSNVAQKVGNNNKNVTMDDDTTSLQMVEEAMDDSI